MRRLLATFIIADDLPRTFTGADWWNLNDDDDGVSSNDRVWFSDGRIGMTGIMREEEEDLETETDEDRSLVEKVAERSEGRHFPARSRDDVECVRRVKAKPLWLWLLGRGRGQVGKGKLKKGTRELGFYFGGSG
ncbi:peptidylprolyl isomerase [Sesbania bispinosa]|nr:peptidylprolyl isomerase [Sesbania bispinosa]